MELEGYFFPDDLKFETNHYWAKLDGDVVITGAGEFISKQAGEITFVDLPEEGDTLTQGKPYGSIESGKWVGRIYAVVSGEVLEVNAALEDEPEMINSDPHGEGWICKIKPSKLADEWETLMAVDGSFRNFIEGEIKKIQEQK